MSIQDPDEGDRRLQDLRFLIARSRDMSQIVGHIIEERGDLSLRVSAALFHVQVSIGALLDALSEEVDDVDGHTEET